MGSKVVYEECPNLLRVALVSMLVYIDGASLVARMMPGENMMLSSVSLRERSL